VVKDAVLSALLRGVVLLIRGTEKGKEKWNGRVKVSESCGERVVRMCE
jgi:hypothetical protein